MPLHLHSTVSPNIQVWIWHITEPESFFLEAMDWSPKQLAWLASIHPIKKMEYYATRYLIFQACNLVDNHLYKDEYGKLHVKDSDLHLSVSHSGPWAGLAVGKKEIGFDLQFITNKILRTAPRFLDEEEFEILAQQNELENFTLAWSIKEAVFKAYGKKNIIFNTQIKLDLKGILMEALVIAKSKLITGQESYVYDITHQSDENFVWALATL